MKSSKSRSPSVLLGCCVALICANLAARLKAEMIAFQFQTTIDAQPVGGRAHAPLIITYAFDSALPNDDMSGLSGGYGPIVLTLQIDDQILTISGPHTGIGVANQQGQDPFISDLYEFGADNTGPQGVPFPGTIFGMQVITVLVQMVDTQATMLDSNDLPLTPAFAKQADFLQIVIYLVDPVTGNWAGLSLNEFADTPAKDLTPFSLTLSNDPIFELIVDVVALELPRNLRDSLLAKLHAAIGSATNAQPDDATAIGQLQAFINQVDAQSGKALTAQQADALATAAEAVILGILASE